VVEKQEYRNVINQEAVSLFYIFVYLSVILSGKLTENTFSFAATTWGIVTGERMGIKSQVRT
jgi:hypothetical protein